MYFFFAEFAGRLRQSCGRWWIADLQHVMHVCRHTKIIILKIPIFVGTTTPAEFTTWLVVLGAASVWENPGGALTAGEPPDFANAANSVIFVAVNFFLLQSCR